VILIAGFSALDKVPGAYGENLWGQGPRSAGSIPLTVLLVGLKGSGGNAVLDTEVIDVTDSGTVETAFEQDSELGLMCLDALLVPGISIKAVAVTPAGSPTAATGTITIAGTPTATGTWEYKIAGTTLTGTITTVDTPTTIASAIRDAINGSSTPLPVSASSALGVVTLTARTPGVRGNQHIFRQSTKQLSPGITSVLAGGTALATGGVPLTGGAGVETYTNLLAAIRPSEYSRIALAANDATSLAAWETQLEAQAGALEGLQQQAITASNGTLSAATSLAQTTLNHVLFQHLHHPNSETHPSRLAAQMAAVRSQAEQSDPAAMFDGVALPNVAPTQRADWQTHSGLVSALNNGVTPLLTGPDGETRVVRSITTKSLTGSTPDYSTLDTSEVTVGHFILKDLKLFWTFEFLPGNPRTAANPAEGERERPAGVATPKAWDAEVEGKLRDYEKGKIGGGTIAPIIIDVDSNKPSSDYDETANRIMSAVPFKAAPGNHQIGISVRQRAA
jgi:phage tail sheath gpL-like